MTQELEFLKVCTKWPGGQDLFQKSFTLCPRGTCRKVYTRKSSVKSDSDILRREFDALFAQYHATIGPVKSGLNSFSKALAVGSAVFGGGTTSRPSANIKGKYQKTRTPGHDVTSKHVAECVRHVPGVKKVFVNLGVNHALDGAAGTRPNPRPDVFYRRGNTWYLIEVVSKSQRQGLPGSVLLDRSMKNSVARAHAAGHEGWAGKLEPGSAQCRLLSATAKASSFLALKKKRLVAVELFTAGAHIVKADNKLHACAEVVGAMGGAHAGGYAGAWVGAEIGAIGGPIGSSVGSLIGAFTGSCAGATFGCTVCSSAVASGRRSQRVSRKCREDEMLRRFYWN